MGRPRKQQQAEVAVATGTVQARHAVEAEREATAKAERDKVMAETKAAKAATAKRLEAKPTDSRTIA